MSELQVDRQTSFARGMRDSASPTEFAPDEVEYLLNGRPSRVGNSLEARGGSRKLHVTALNSGEAGLGAKEYAAADRTNGFVVMVGDKWYGSTDDGETWTEIGGANGYSEIPWSIVLMRVGSGEPHHRVERRARTRSRGPAARTMSWTSTNWPANIKFLAVFNDRLYGTRRHDHGDWLGGRGP